MGRFTRIPEKTFEELQLDAGILLYQFNPSNPNVLDTDIICATTGGINISAVPTFSDFGEDVDNCPINMKELKHLDSWECTMGFTALVVSSDAIQLALGAATIAGSEIIPNRDLRQTDFKDLWWVGDRADGGFVAVKLINALSTSGFVLQTTKNGKGQVSVTLTGHVSINEQNLMPMLFYTTEEGGSLLGSILLDKHVISIEAIGDTKELHAVTVPDDASVTWSTSSDAVATVNNGVVTAVATGSAIITASITYESIVYNDTCTVIVTNNK